MRMSITTLAFSLLFNIGMAAAEEMNLPPYQGSTAFESMKSLAGAWEGVHTMGEKKESVRVDYRVSSNGSTIIETLFPGHQHEMMTVYHDKGGKLSMTHYCSIGNQPQMDLVRADGNTLEFALASEAVDINVAKDGHMHGLFITMVDKDHLLLDWTMYQDGKQGEQTNLKLARVQ